MLGPFEIIDAIGQGGMGTVFRGHHRPTGRTVALKVLRAEFADDPTYLEGFHREVRAIARLDHPGIVRVYDYGIVSSDAADAHSQLQPDALWLAMEFADGGSLAEHDGPFSWPALRSLLVQILDALAHAHARGLVHRDIKPDNVLRRPDQLADDHPGWMLTDFGLAHSRDPEINERTGDVSSAVAGTPYFMAPEQFHGYWRDFGPWTDLYALGAMAYFLAAGRPVFNAPSPMAVGLKHIAEPVPQLNPVVTVPLGFENWLRRLLAKDIGARFRRAADAAAALISLGDPKPTQRREPDEPAEVSIPPTLTLSTEAFTDAETSTNLRTQLLDEDELHAQLAADRHETTDAQPPASGTFPARRVVAPRQWDEQHDERRPHNIPGTGKGIFEVRQPPYVGRRNQRDLLWQQLRSVVTRRRARFVLIRGDAGIGKTRLMQWLATRAHELGVATTLTARHSPIMSTGDGLARAFQTFLSTTGLDRPALIQRLRSVYATYFDEEPDEQHLAALVEWMSPRTEETDDDLPVVRLESELSRFLLAQRLLEQICRRRPAVLCIDDGQWAQDSLGFARHLLAARNERPIPALIVATVRPESLRDRLVEQQLLETLIEFDSSTVIDLDALDDAHQLRLIDSLLGLDQNLAQSIHQMAGGNPLFAVQLIEDWVGRNVLEDSPDGYVLAEGEEIPDDLNTLLTRRIEAVITGYNAPDDARTSLEVAAALGVAVDDREWRTVCSMAGAQLPDSLVPYLIQQSVAVPHPQGWRFRLPLYRDVLEQLSRQHGRWATLNAHIADAIDTAGQNGTCLHERRGRHLLAARQPVDAIDHFWQAISTRMQQSAYAQALSLTALLEELFDQLDYPPEHPDRVRLKIPRAESHRFLGDTPRAQQLYDELRDELHLLDDHLRAEAHRSLGSFANHCARFQQALQEYGHARDLFDQVDDTRGLARTLDGMGWTHQRIGQVDDARRIYRTGYQLADAAGLQREAGWCLTGLAHPLPDVDPDQSGGHARQALARFEAAGCRSGMAVAHWLLGDYERLQQNLDRARRHYQRTRELGEMVGHNIAANASVGLLGICDLFDGDIERAEQRIRHFRDTIGTAESTHFIAPLADLGMLGIAAHHRDTDAFDQLVEQLHSAAEDPGLMAINFRVILRHIHRICLDHDDARRADAIEGLLNALPQSDD